MVQAKLRHIWEAEVWRLLTNTGVDANAMCRTGPSVSGSRLPGFKSPLPATYWVTLGKLLNLQMGVIAEPPYRVMGEMKERCLAVSTAPCTKPPATVPVASAYMCCSGCRGLGGSSKALSAFIYGYRKSHPGEEQGRSPFPRFPQVPPAQRALADYSALPLTWASAALKSSGAQSSFIAGMGAG